MYYFTEWPNNTVDHDKKKTQKKRDPILYDFCWDILLHIIN